MGARVLKNEMNSQLIEVNEKKNLDFYKVKENVIKQFNEEKEKGNVYAREFNDEIWLLKDNNYNVKISFKGFTFKSLYAVKCFCLSMITGEISSRHIQKRIKAILEFINITNDFDIRKIEYCSKFLKNMDSMTKGRKCEHVYRYLQFTESFDNSYTNLFKRYKGYQSNIRKIQGFSKVIKFDILLSDFFQNCSLEMKQKYYPIFLWWKITTILPMRPIEFAELEINCCIKENDKYYIRIWRRRKGEKYGREKRNLHVLEVNKYIYDIINYYKDIVNTAIDDDREYLVSYKLYNKFVKNPEEAMKQKYNTKFLELRQYHTLLNSFNTEVIGDIYNCNEIKKFTLIDTRHIAIMNMFLQGVNPYTIAYMAYHEKVTTQNSYYNHIETYIDSYTLELANQIKTYKSGNGIPFRFMFDDNQLLTRSKIFNIEKKKGRRIEQGFCTDSLFPNNCANITCIDCKYYMIDLNKASLIKNESSKYIRKIDLKIREQEELLRYMHKKIIENNNEVKSDKLNEKVSSIAKSLSRSIIKKSVVLSNNLE